MKHKPLPDLARVAELLAYSKSSGKFRWKMSPTNKVAKGSRAGTIMQNGYVHIQVDGVLYLAHRLAWLLVEKCDPAEAQIDHKNRVRHDNRWPNLRLAVNKDADNLQNLSLRKDCASGVPGVHWDIRKQRWRAYIGSSGKNLHLGYFTRKQDAIKARRQAKQRLHLFNPKDAL